jgi:dTDP-4-amino-4,6-dideoxygalactose transaminase
MLIRTTDVGDLIKKFRFKEPIFVTKTHLPDLKLFNEYLQIIWKNNWVTNNGELHQELEIKLANFLEANYVSLFCNGTLALMTALHALGLSGEVITTPFTFPATLNVLHWKGINPVFCDIDTDTFNIDTNKIESFISSKTAAILAVHVYGFPCNVKALDDISTRHGIKVIYDAAHAFGVKLNGKSLANFGDITAFSFHATKLYHTFEGGALSVKDLDLKRRIDYLKNFGIHDEDTVVTPGINAKMNEVQAAMGLIGLCHVGKEIERRKKVHREYVSLLKSLNGIKLPNVSIENFEYNYAYFPIIVNKEEANISRDRLYNVLKKCNVFTRKYFFPLCSNYPFFSSLPSASKKNLPQANKIADGVLCLPMYGALELEKVERICLIISHLVRG